MQIIHVCWLNSKRVMHLIYSSYDQLPLFLTVPQLAEVLDIGLNSAYALARSKKIRAVRIGKQYRIPKESVRELFLSGPEARDS